MLPGLGQLAMGRGRRALFYLLPTLMALSWLGLQLGQGLASFGLSFFDDTFVVTLTVIVASLGIWRIAAVGDAFLQARGRRRWPRLETAIVVALAFSIAATHLLVIGGAWMVYGAGNAINNNDMLSNGSLDGGSPVPGSPSPIPTATATPAPTPQDTSAFAPYASTEPGLTPTPSYPTNPDRITFLLIGVDFMTGRNHALTDTMMLATLDVHTNKVTLISVPRDTSNFDLYYGGWVSPQFKLNQLMEAASSPASVRLIRASRHWSRKWLSWSECRSTTTPR